MIGPIKNTNQTYCITGFTGYIGKNLVKHLKKIIKNSSFLEDHIKLMKITIILFIGKNQKTYQNKSTI